jgi:hypothetical protein
VTIVNTSRARFVSAADHRPVLAEELPALRGIHPREGELLPADVGRAQTLLKTLPELYDAFTTPPERFTMP